MMFAGVPAGVAKPPAQQAKGMPIIRHLPRPEPLSLPFILRTFIERVAISAQVAMLDIIALSSAAVNMIPRTNRRVLLFVRRRKNAQIRSGIVVSARAALMA